MDKQAQAMEVDIEDKELMDTLSKFEMQSRRPEDEKQTACSSSTDHLTNAATTSKELREGRATKKQEDLKDDSTAAKDQPKIDTFFLRTATKKPFDPNACRKCKNPIRW